MQVKLHPISRNVEGRDAQYAPYEIHWTCEGCGAANVVSLYEQPLDRPVFGRVLPFQLFCPKCSREDTVWLHVEITVEVVARAQMLTIPD